MPADPLIAPLSVHPLAAAAADVALRTSPLGRLMAGIARLAQAPAPLRVAVAVALFMVALGGRFVLNGVLPNAGFPFLTFFPAVLLAAFLTGLGPALLVSAASVLAAWYFFIGPAPAFSLATADLIAVGFFSVILVIDCVVIHALKSALLRVSRADRLYRQSQAELLEREASLRAADRQKDIFLATLAHELRNPLAPIRTAAELIHLRSTDSEPLRQAAAVIERQVLHLAHLVDDLLDVSRLTRDTIELRLETLDLRTVVAHAIETIRPAVDAAGQHLSYSPGVRPVLVHGDAMRLGQCVTNLLTNAAKFTPRGGCIGLQMSESAGSITLVVQDSGVGIEPASLERIFQLFVQERPSGLSGQSGLGLGLALTRKLVVLHGGTVTAGSAGLGKGSQFSMTLPASTAPLPPPAPQAPPVAVARAAAPAPLPGAPVAAQLLLIEDNEDAAELLGQLLTYSGFAVRLAHRGADALLMAEQSMPEVVLLDIGLPDLDGYEVCRRLRGLPGGEQSIVVALTGWGTQHERERASQAGCDAHLTKPAAPDDLLELLERLLAAQRERHALSA